MFFFLNFPIKFFMYRNKTECNEQTNGIIKILTHEKEKKTIKNQK